ncbi:hypothetical protein ACIBEJ_30520 [Nonomuraea sp. NPDC050790]|uniref:hypothetical protein n=1 Tax=Nonomuraea sp. NPDC050790 TaxID=3364371 RepID=UPI0037999F59
MASRYFLAEPCTPPLKPLCTDHGEAVLRALAVQPPRLLPDPGLIDSTEARQQAPAYPPGHPLAQAVTDEVIARAEAGASACPVDLYEVPADLGFPRLAQAPWLSWKGGRS